MAYLGHTYSGSVYGTVGSTSLGTILEFNCRVGRVSFRQGSSLVRTESMPDRCSFRTGHKRSRQNGRRTRSCERTNSRQTDFCGAKRSRRRATSHRAHAAASDSAHVLPEGSVSKQRQIVFVRTHAQRRFAEPKSSMCAFYRNSAITDRIVLLEFAGESGMRTRTFTDVFAFRNGRWQAVNTQETLSAREAKFL